MGIYHYKIGRLKITDCRLFSLLEEGEVIKIQNAYLSPSLILPPLRQAQCKQGGDANDYLLITIN